MVVAAIAFILSRLLRLITLHMIRVAEQHAAGPGRIAQVKTLAGVIRATGLAIIGVIAGLQFLDALGVNLGPLLASAGVAGIAIGLAAQNIVKDMLNGILILIEDQFNVGDTVRLAGLAGTVEAMTLRKTTVRDADGTLYVIPNSQITTVANLSVGYSVATVNVSVDFSANPDEVLKLLKASPWRSATARSSATLFVADPQILGVDAVKGSELIFPGGLQDPGHQAIRARCGSSAAGSGWRWRSTTCCPATPTGSSTLCRTGRSRARPSRPWKKRRGAIRRLSSRRRAIPLVGIRS